MLFVSTFDLKIHAKKGKNAETAKMQKCKKRQKMHAQFENSRKIEQKCIFNFKIHTKKDKNEKKKVHPLTGGPCAFFCIFNLQNHAKKILICNKR